MSLALTTIENTPQRGLDSLVAQLESGGLESLKGSWQRWFEAAVAQLEVDDSIDSRLTDEIADCLGEAEDAITAGYSCQPALHRLVCLYHRHQERLPLEGKWRRRAAGLGTAQLESATWSDLQAALDAAAAGRIASVAQWLDLVEHHFLASWERYEEGEVLEAEITTESVLCHRFLMEGTELWLEALATFRESLAGPINRAGVLELAEAGQRQLILVQILEEEAEEAMDRFFSWATN